MEQRLGLEREVDDWTKEEKDGVYNLFNQFDKDKSGTIDGEELGNLISALGLKAVTVADIDTGVSNGIRDGVIDHDEFLKWYSSPAAVVADALRRLRERVEPHRGDNGHGEAEGGPRLAPRRGGRRRRPASATVFERRRPRGETTKRRAR